MSTALKNYKKMFVKQVIKDEIAKLKSEGYVIHLIEVQQYIAKYNDTACYTVNEEYLYHNLLRCAVIDDGTRHVNDFRCVVQFETARCDVQVEMIREGRFE